MNTSVDTYIDNLKNWKAETSLLREILINCGLEETMKWKNPCYMYQQKNVAMLGGFKAYCALSFFKGTLLKDELDLLQSPGENSQSVKLMRFTNIQEINTLESEIKAYTFEVIAIEKSGLKVALRAKDELTFTLELTSILNGNRELKKAFYALTPGRQRGYNLYFSAAKQSKSRISRIEKYIPRILSGKGFHDCVCGHSKRMPTCDGSHKYL